MSRLRVAAAAIALLAACGWEGTGVVVGRQYEPAHTEIRQAIVDLVTEAAQKAARDTEAPPADPPDPG